MKSKSQIQTYFIISKKRVVNTPQHLLGVDKAKLKREGIYQNQHVQPIFFVILFHQNCSK